MEDNRRDSMLIREGKAVARGAFWRRVWARWLVVVVWIVFSRRVHAGRKERKQRVVHKAARKPYWDGYYIDGWGTIL